MPAHEDAGAAEARLARELAALPDEARSRVVLGALALAADGRGKARRLSSDAIAALAATVVAVASLILTVDQAHTQRKQLAAAVWPSLRIGYSNFEDPEHPRHRVFLANGGVGPARIQSFSITWRGKPVTHAEQWAAAACPAVASDWTYSTQTGTLLSPGGQVTVMSHARLTGDDERCVREAMLEPSELRACYCSVLDECWETSSSASEPVPVHDCVAAARRPQFEHGD